MILALSICLAAVMTLAAVAALILCHDRANPRPPALRRRAFPARLARSYRGWRGIGLGRIESLRAALRLSWC